VLCIAGLVPCVSSFSEPTFTYKVRSVRGDQRVSALRAVKTPQTVCGTARNTSVHMDVFSRACVAISAALQPRS